MGSTVPSGSESGTSSQDEALSVGATRRAKVGKKSDGGRRDDSLNGADESTRSDEL